MRPTLTDDRWYTDAIKGTIAALSAYRQLRRQISGLDDQSPLLDIINELIRRFEPVD